MMDCSPTATRRTLRPGYPTQSSYRMSRAGTCCSCSSTTCARRWPRLFTEVLRRAPKCLEEEFLEVAARAVPRAICRSTSYLKSISVKAVDDDFDDNPGRSEER